MVTVITVLYDYLLNYKRLLKLYMKLVAVIGQKVSKSLTVGTVMAANLKDTCSRKEYSALLG